MGEAFITRRGGEAVERTTAPSINFVSKTDSEIVVTFTNNDAAEAEVFFGITSTLTDTVTLAAAATSSNITFSGLDDDTAFTVSAFALVTDPTSKKIKSEIVTSTITTDKFVFDPATLSPQLWMDAADATTITASSGSVSQWNNKGSLSNFTQGTSANQPTTGVSTLNGLNVIDFNSDVLNGVNQNEWKFMHDGTIYELFVVAKIGTSVDPGFIVGIIGNDGSASNTTGAGLLFNDDTGSNDISYIVRKPGASVDNDPAFIREENYVVGNQFNILSVFADPTNATIVDRMELRKNGGSLVKTNDRTSTVSTDNPTSPLQIGGNFRSGGTDRLLIGSIAEIIIISGATATSNNRTTVINYLADKWGITI